jgi:thioredoxin-like negative regulator of GroEL
LSGSQLDQEIKDLEKLDEDDLEAIRRRKLDMMNLMQEKKVEWKSAGHGEYSEIPEEKEFFTVTKGSDNCVIHFYRDETFRCKIFDKHFSMLAKKHLETRFCKINAEKCPFLCDRLKIKVIPTVLCIKNQQTTANIVGFGDLGNTDEFSTEMLEWRLAHAEVINYSGDLNTPPDQAERKKTTNFIGKKVKGKGRRNDDDSSDENDW